MRQVLGWAQRVLETGVGEVEEGMRGINGDLRRLEHTI